MESIEVLINQDEVEQRIKSLGEAISRDYKGKSIHLVCILKGGAPFMCQLAKYIDCEVTYDFMSVSSYSGGTTSSGVVKIVKDLDETIENRHVIIVEDIIDTGRTLSHLIEIFKKRNPASIKLCTLLDKPERRVVDDVNVEYVGFRIPDEFVVGYGMDYDERYRNLPYIGVIKFKED